MPVTDEMVRAMMAAEPWSSFWSEDDARKLIDAVYPMIREAVLAEAVALAQSEEDSLRETSERTKERPDIFPVLARERELQAVTALEIKLGLLALATAEPEEDGR